VSTISFSGVGTGIDWSAVVDAQVQVRTQQLVTPLQNTQSTYQNQLSAYDQLRSLLTDLQSAVQAMDTPDELRSYSASSSSSSVSAAVSSGAAPGSHTLLVNQLASAQVETHAGVADDAAVLNDTGASASFTYSYAGNSTTLNVASGTTLEELVGLINNDPANPGLTASILDDGSGGATSHHLVLRGNDQGAANTVVIDPATTLAGFGQDAFSEVQPAANAQFRIDGYPPAGWIERDSNVIDDVVPGLTMTLNGTNNADPVTVSVAPDVDGVKEKISAFVTAYNAVKTYLNSNTGYDAQSKKAGVLQGSYAATLIEQRLQDIIVDVAPGLVRGTDPYTTLGQVGISTVGEGQDDSLGTLSVDDAKLTDALNGNFESVIRLFASSGGGSSDSQYISFYQASSTLTAAGTYDVQVDFDASGNLTAARIKGAGESTWRDAAVGGGYIHGQTGNPESGLWLRALWDGASGTQSATVNVQQGKAGQISGLIDDVLDISTGLLHNAEQADQDVIGNLDDRISAAQEQIDSLSELLKERYARLEEQLVQMQGRQQWITSTAASLGWTA
jgi:flagellar hook-associated protein 2